MLKSETIAELAKALSAFQGELKSAKKDETNPFFKSKYADLASVWEAIKAPLSKNGLSVSQLPHMEGDKLLLTTLLLHSSGEWISSEYPIISMKPDPQAMGSALTYARRYTLSSVLGVASDEDDDANIATKLKPATKSSLVDEAKKLGAVEISNEETTITIESPSSKETESVPTKPPVTNTKELMQWALSKGREFTPTWVRKQANIGAKDAITDQMAVAIYETLKEMSGWD